MRADHLDEAFATAAELTKTRLLNIPSRQLRLVNACAPSLVAEGMEAIHFMSASSQKMGQSAGDLVDSW